MNTKIILIIAIVCVAVSSIGIVYATNSLVITGSLTANVVTIDNPTITISTAGENAVDLLRLYENSTLVSTYDFNPDVDLVNDVPTELDHIFGRTIGGQTTYHEKAVVKNTTFSTQNNTNDDFSGTGWVGYIWAEKFTGLPVGEDVNAVGLYVLEPHGNVRIKLYEDVPCPPEEACDSVYRDQIHNYQTTTANTTSGIIYAQKFDVSEMLLAQDFDSGVNIDTVTIKTTGSVTGCGGFSNCPLRIGIYSDNAGVPDEALAQAGCDITSGETECLLQYTLCRVSDQSNCIFWVSIQFKDSDSTQVYESTGLASGTQVYATQAYGTSVPEFFPTTTSSTTAFYLEINTVGETSDSPTSLLAQTSSLPITDDGIVYFPIDATIPSNGIVWAAFETTSNLLELAFSDDDLGTVRGVSHTYGVGNDPFSHLQSNSLPNMVDLGTPPWIGLRYDRQTDTIIVQSNTLTFNPAYVPSYSGNCGISICSPKPVNYTYTRSANFTQLNLIVNVLPIPFNIECNIANHTFNQVGAWHNFTNVNALNLTVNVVPNDNAYGVCYGSGQLLSFTSYGNQSRIVTGANVFNGSFGAMLGVPIGTFVIVMFGSLANQRTAPIWVVILLAIIGIMSTISFFTLQSGTWALVLIAGMLGLFVGRKVF